MTYTYTPPAMRVADGSLKPMGYQQITGLSAAKSLTVPDGALMAIIQIEAKDVRYRDDGVAPSASVGLPMATAEKMLYTGNLAALKFIEQTAGAIINVLYYI